MEGVAESVVREWAQPPEYVVGAHDNATDDVFGWAARDPAHVGFVRKVGGEWRPVTAKEFAGQVTALAAGLMAAGIRPGDRIARLSATRFEWLLCDFAIWTAGAVTVPIYETSSLEQVRWILRDSGAVAVFAEGERLAAGVEQVAVESIREIWRFDLDVVDELRFAGKNVPLDQVAERRRGVGPSSLATIVYTSGTTGRPKGCMIDHGSLVAEVRNVARARGIGEYALNENSSILLFLPLAHIFARVIQLCAVHAGACLGHAADLGTVQAELASLRPTLVLSVPRVFEKVAAAAREQAAAHGHERLFRAARATAIAYSKAADGHGPGLPLRLWHRLFDQLVYSRVRAALGRRVAYAVSGGAPLNAELGHFFRGAGINILEGWGLTETTAGVTMDLPAAQRIGSTGPPLPGCGVRIAADGEVLAQGGASSPATGTIPRRPARSSWITGCAPATWALWTVRGSCTSPAARRI